ncbi:putative barwin-related endoglucanase protein [Neofusicoccum parvum UCRNP2]|uniref:Putative barwin-related endoglucanase protein n=1 Tax=Botryosphaeria parva (strain UCR-NP2) TaxID=1287680 RepID=R1GCA6_BOTPV|nr:putative barwin-related endoglucanase protein [Neofusicoccum parvum UCRNP2]
MKATGIIALSLLGLAAAAPHRQHLHAHDKAKRELVMVTETAEVVETVVATTTVWVDPEDVPATTAPTTTEEPVYTAPPAPTTTEEAPAPETTSEASSTSVYVAPAPTTSETPSSTYTPPAPTTTETPTSTYVAPAPETTSSSTSSAIVAAETAASSGSDSAPAGSEVYNPSRITYYSPSVGTSSCGEVYSDDSNVVALSSGNMNSNLCNAKITIELNGKTFPAFIGETCPGCPSDHSLDITPGLFTKMMGSTDAGVIRDAKWWFD